MYVIVLAQCWYVYKRLRSLSYVNNSALVFGSQKCSENSHAYEITMTIEQLELRIQKWLSFSMNKKFTKILNYIVKRALFSSFRNEWKLHQNIKQVNFGLEFDLFNTFDIKNNRIISVKCFRNYVLTVF